jgi:hypothetical protein
MLEDGATTVGVSVVVRLVSGLVRWAVRSVLGKVTTRLLAAF